MTPDLDSMNDALAVELPKIVDAMNAAIWLLYPWGVR